MKWKRWIVSLFNFFSRLLPRSEAPSEGPAPVLKPSSPSWEGLPIGEHLDVFLEECAAEGLAVRVTEVARSAARQDALYAQGRTAPGRIVTWTRESAHIGGRAFDVTLVGAHEYDDDPEAWQLLGAIGEDLGLEWGGHFQDYGHFELPS